MKSIGDYAVIGDCRSVALVGRDASIDWLCWPRFDSPSIFGALLDDNAGRWSLAPVQWSTVERAYVDHTNVLTTRFVTESGSVVVTDLMPVASESDKRRLPLPDHEILRIAQCVDGEVELEMHFAPRPDYARGGWRLRNAGTLGVRVERGAELLTLRTDMPLTEFTRDTVRGRVRLRAGAAVHASLTFANDAPALLPPLGDWSQAALRRSVAWWSEWASRLEYDGPLREMVLRSALAVKLLAYAPSGAVVAAATTSLPERIGGSWNWDYRFCWLRDASLTIRALLGIGCLDEAHAFVTWLLQATRLTQPALRVLYDVHGNEPAAERILEQFNGFCGSRPVRLGNAAASQRQLDVYGEVIDAFAHLVAAGGTLDGDARSVLVDFGEHVCAHWHEPDEGIWEPRTGKSLHTHSRLLCWTALDRLLELHAHGHLPNAPEKKFRDVREQIRRDISDRAWNPRLRSYASQLDGDAMDATLLLLSWYGFEEPTSDRMRLTHRRVRDVLGAGGPLLYRYPCSGPEREGAFGCCGFWGVEYLALGGGTPEEARDAFVTACGYANDVGLFAEEIEPSTGAALGNFPQAFTHIGLINAAVSLARRLRGADPHDVRIPDSPSTRRSETAAV